MPFYEDKNVKQSLESLKTEIEKHPDIFNSEATICARLYFYLCNSISDGFERIRLECKLSDYTTMDIGDANIRKKRMKDCVKRNFPNNNPPPMEGIAKAGKYDLAILDKQQKNIVHVIELKYLNQQGFSRSDRHRAYEDLYLLSEKFLKEIKIDCHSSAFVFLRYGVRRSETKVKQLIQDLKVTFKNAGVKYFESAKNRKK